MKKILLIILLPFAFAISAKAGNFTLTHGDTLGYGKSNSAITFDACVNNSLGTSQNYKLTKLTQSLPSGWGISFCTPAGCYPVSTNSSTFSVSGGGSGYILLEFHTSSVIGSGTATFRFENVSTPSDVIEITYTAVVNSFIPQYTDTIETASLNSTKKQWAGTCYNNTPAALDVTMKVLTYNIPSDWDFDICTPAPCVSGTSIGSSSFSIGTGSSYFTNTSIDWHAGTTAATGSVTIRYEDDSNPLYFYDQTFYLDALTTGIDAGGVAASSISNYPNPSSGNTTFKYDLGSIPRDAKIVIADFTGRSLMTIPLHEQSSAVYANDDLPTGLYIYSLYNDGQKLQSKRMQIVD